MNQSIRRILAGFAISAAIGLTVPLAAQQSTDASFLMAAIRDNMAEIKIGELAERQASSEAARDFAEMLQADHARALQKHAALARSQNVTVPTEITAEQQRTYEKLAKLSGADFDREFAQAMVTDHQKAIAAYEKEATSGGVPNIVELANETLPTLREHLAHAEALAGGGIRTSQRPDASSNVPRKLE